MLVRSVSLVLLFFFFSSRRRHTRLVSDWSSDVCSSDLSFRVAATGLDRKLVKAIASGNYTPSPRSEERRVGKECRSGRSPYDEKKNETTQLTQRHMPRCFPAPRRVTKVTEEQGYGIHPL